MARAQFIMWSEGRLHAVFGLTVTDRYLRRLAAQLGSMSGVTAQVVQEQMGSAHMAPVHAVKMAARPDEWIGAAQELKRLAQPEVPYSLKILHVQLVRCKGCGRLRLAATGDFVPGLGPAKALEQEAFRTRLSEGLLRLPLAQLLPRGVNSSRDALADALDGAVRAAGAYPSEMDVRPVDDPRPCRHRR